MTIYLVRHGETDWNALGRIQGHTDIPLNAKGIEQAQALIPIVRRLNIKSVLASDLSRAQETARIVTQELDLKINTDSRLREANMGEAEGMKNADMLEKYGHDSLHAWRSNSREHLSYSFPGGETGYEVLDRVTDALAHYSEFLESPVLVVSHGGSIRRILQNALNKSENSFWVPNGVVFPVNFSSETGEIELILDLPL